MGVCCGCVVCALWCVLCVCTCDVCECVWVCCVCAHVMCVRMHVYMCTHIHMQMTLNLSQDGLVDDQPVWAMVFYCMRCGNLDDALTAVSKASAAP